MCSSLSAVDSMDVCIKSVSYISMLLQIRAAIDLN